MPGIYGREICLLIQSLCWRDRDLWKTFPRTKKLAGAVSLPIPQPGITDTGGNKPSVYILHLAWEQ